MQQMSSTPLENTPLSTVGLVGQPTPYPVLAEQCRALAHEMRDRAEDNPSNLCAGDIKVAAAYIQAACMNIEQQTFIQALYFMEMADQELDAIGLYDIYCGHLAKDAERYRSKVARLQGEIVALEYFNTVNPLASLNLWELEARLLPGGGP